MSAVSAVAIDTAIVTALKASAAIKALVGNPARVYDHVPEETAYPYIEVGEVVDTPFDDKSTTGLEHAITLHVWSRYRGRKETKQILDALHALLHRGTLTVSGNSHVLTRFVSNSTFRDPDGLTYHGVAIYDVIVQST
ncbi:MAG: DUF3168 domain-containing protein [Hyphomicrobiaceae bacterium]